MANNSRGSTTTIKVSVEFLIRKVKEAKANYLKEFAKEKAQYAKDLANYKVARTEFDKLAKEIFLNGLKNGEVDTNYYGIVVPTPNKISTPTAPREPESDTRKFDMKLSMLEGAVDEAITIKVSDEEWAVFL